MKVGAEKNKVIVLAAVSLIAAYTVYSQIFAGPATVKRPPPEPAQQTARPRPKRSTPAKTQRQTSGGQFRPTFGTGDDDEVLDPMTVDPTLRTDLLANVRAVEFTGVERNLFQFGERKKKVEPPSADQLAEAQKRLDDARKVKAGPAKKPASAAGTPKKAPPIQLKYYGFAHEPNGLRRRAFLLDGEDILIGGEGDVFKKRYQIVRIGMNGIVMKDLQFDEDQTLNLEEI